jgi:hypothetical protein
MTEKLTLKKLSGEMETLRTQILELEQRLDHKIETLEKATAKLRSTVETSVSPEHGASIDADYRQRLVAEEAYLIAEQRGFQNGDPAQDWAKAEERVNHRLMLEGEPRGAATRTRRAVTKKAASKHSRRAK